MAIDNAALSLPPGGVVDVSARRVRGAVLVRIGCLAGDDAGATMKSLKERVGRTNLRELLDAAGGSILVESREGAALLSIRLALAKTAPADGGREPARGAA
jgi:hypothetical protein